MPIILVTAGIGAIATGVVTVGIEKHLHAVVSAVGFLGHVAMPFAMAAGPVSGAIRLLSTIAGLSSVAFLIVWIAGMVGLTGFGPVGKGGMQLLILFPIVLWVVAIGGWLMVPRRFAARASGSDQTYKPTRA
jgi:hypothetical protein